MKIPRDSNSAIVFWVILILSLFAISRARAGDVEDTANRMNPDDRKVVGEFLAPIDVSFVSVNEQPMDQAVAYFRTVATMGANRTHEQYYVIGIDGNMMSVTTAPDNPDLSAKITEVLTWMTHSNDGPRLIVISGANRLAAILPSKVLKSLPATPMPFRRPHGAPLPAITMPTWWKIPAWQVGAAVASVLALIYAAVCSLRRHGPKASTLDPTPIQAWTPLNTGKRPNPIKIATPAPVAVRPPDRIRPSPAVQEVVYPNVVPPVRPGVVTTVPPMTTCGMDRSIPMQVNAPGWSEYYDSSTGNMVILGPSGQRDILTPEQYKARQQQAWDMAHHNTVFHGLQQQARAYQSDSQAQNAACNISRSY